MNLSSAERDVRDIASVAHFITDDEKSISPSVLSGFFGIFFAFN